MVDKKREQDLDERLDSVGRRVVRAAASNETAASVVASSPFLYARLRARITSERERREEGERWFTLLGIAWRAVPAMALTAIFAFALFWSASLGMQSPSNFSLESLLNTRDAGIEQVVFADRQPLSSDEVLATILSDDERETTR
jgi:Holliday junction resolvase